MRRDQPGGRQRLIQPIQDRGERLGAHPLKEDGEGGMIEDRVIEGEMTEPAPGQVLGDALTQGTMAGLAVQGTKEQGPQHDLRMNGRTATSTVGSVQWLGIGGKIQGGVDAQEQMLRLQAVSQGPARTAIEGTVPAGTVDRA